PLPTTYRSSRTSTSQHQPNQHRTNKNRPNNITVQTAQILMWRPQDHFTYHLINAWPTKLAPQFWQLLATKSPVALLVLAYFAAVASLRPNLWWLHRWPQLLVRDITARLGKAWEEALAWPIQIVNDHPQHMQ
ncbi:hypothetical protein WHR41_09507, partial [Cladosporium halotolerans]